MASPVSVHASHPNSHFFREHPNYHEDFRSRNSHQSAMGPVRTHPYRRERSQSPFKRNLDYQSSRYREQESSRQARVHVPYSPVSMHSPRSPVSMQPPSHAMSHQGSASTTRPSTSDANRIAVGHLVEHYPSTRHSPVQQESQNAPRTPPSSSSPHRGAPPLMENGRLPGIGSLLGLAPERDEDRWPRYAASGPNEYHQPRYQGHSAASSLSSAFSEPTSPRSYGQQHSRSPVVQQGPVEGVARASMHPPYHRREESLPQSQYERSYQRSQTLPSVPTHYAQQSSSHPFSDPALPPPPPPGPSAMLPPPPDPYYQNHQNHRTQYEYTPAYPQHHPNNSDRPRTDSSAFSGMYDPRAAATMPGYAWGYQGLNGNGSMARKRRGNLPKEATRMLKEWFGQHLDSPYPTEDQKQELCGATGLQISQVNNWFINARRRLPRENAKKLIDANGDRAGTVESTDSDVQLDPELVAQRQMENGMRYS